MEQSVKIGIRIAKILRHDPEGLKITNDGYVNVQDLLDHLKLDKDDLDYIVEFNNKKRFTYNSDETMIRASQGHSIGINLHLSAKRPPNELFHGTSISAIAEIKKSGFISKMKRDYLHLSSDSLTAYNVGKRHVNNANEINILTINAKQMYMDKYNFYISENGVWLTETVPTKYIKNLL